MCILKKWLDLYYQNSVFLHVWFVTFFCSAIMYQRTRTLQRASTCQTLSKFSFIYYFPAHADGEDVLSEGEILNNARCLWCYSFNPYFLALSILELLFLLVISRSIKIYIHPNTMNNSFYSNVVFRQIPNPWPQRQQIKESCKPQEDRPITSMDQLE